MPSRNKIIGDAQRPQRVLHEYMCLMIKSSNLKQEKMRHTSTSKLVLKSRVVFQYIFPPFLWTIFCIVKHVRAGQTINHSCGKVQQIALAWLLSTLKSALPNAARLYKRIVSADISPLEALQEGNAALQYQPHNSCLTPLHPQSNPSQRRCLLLERLHRGAGPLGSYPPWRKRMLAVAG